MRMSSFGRVIGQDLLSGALAGMVVGLRSVGAAVGAHGGGRLSCGGLDGCSVWMPVRYVSAAEEALRTAQAPPRQASLQGPTADAAWDCGATAGDSDSDISRGMMAVMFESLQDLTPEQILEVRTDAWAQPTHTQTASCAVARVRPVTKIKPSFSHSARHLSQVYSVRQLRRRRTPSVMRTLRTS